jgi:energy-coupling factor transporter ATP-binding protein EcfA2
MSYLEEIKKKYDVKDHVESKIVVPALPQEGIVLIVGTSGSGKSTILKSLGEYQTPKVRPDLDVIENFTSPELGENLLLATGLRTIPAWFRPASTLSNGEYHRLEMALCLDQGITAIDEFTSVVDRDTAKSLAYSVRKWFDNQDTHKVLYIASCHRDIIDWLDPDHVYNTDIQELTQRRSLHLRLGRPTITLTIQSTNAKYWKYFSKYHYLDSAVSKSAHYYVGLLGDKPIAFLAAIHSTNRDIHSYWREHRTVVLPEFQGLGIGNRFSEAIAQIYVDRGLRFFSKTAHPSFGEHREKSNLWRPTSTNRKLRTSTFLNKDGSVRVTPCHGGTNSARTRDAYRVCYSHEYMGKK